MLSGKSRRGIILFLLIVITGFCGPVLFSQRLEVSCTNKPLNQLLVELRQQYSLQFSFDDAGLSRYPISLKGQYENDEELMNALLKGLSLRWERMGKVLVISPVAVVKEPKLHVVSGQVFDRISGEPLPYTHVFINNYNTVTDLKGAFSYKTIGDSVFHLMASHLGCFIVDTVLLPDNNHKIYLSPISQDLPEVIIRDNIVQRSVQVGEEPGQMVLNSYIANYIPGNGDNSVFNLLRLQPGILAAGEQPNDIIIWGSAEGTSRVQFDGFTIWGLKNFNDQISAVNPFMAKTINVLKGGYDVTNTDVVGGLVNIAGKLGGVRKPALNLFVNNQTLNGMVELPVFKKSTLLFAYRQNYYNLFDELDILRANPNSNASEIKVSPDYSFRDFNFKYSLQGDNGDLFYLSVLGAKDQFSYKASQEKTRYVINQETFEHNNQFGGALFYGKNWRGGSTSQFKVAFSSLRSDFYLGRSVKNIRFNKVNKLLHSSDVNNIGELTVEAKNSVQLFKRHTIDYGAEWVRNEVLMQQDTFDVVMINITEHEMRTSFFVQDAISFGDGISIVPGLRTNYLMNNKHVFVSPRIAFKMGWNQPWKFNVAWGLYHQFLVKTSVMDESGNFRYSWAVANNEDVPILKSNHFSSGLSYHFNTFTASVEGYYKTTKGLTNYIRIAREKDWVFEGDGRSYGLDFYVKKDFGRHTFWTSYTLGRAEELFPYFLDKQYRRAPHDQRHEIKGAALFNLHPFHLSAAYVYGSGFPLYASYISKKYTVTDYSRLDISLVYKLKTKRMDGEIGCSILNVLNSDNVKYSSFERIPLDQLSTVYIDAEALDFTPLVFLKIQF